MKKEIAPISSIFIKKTGMIGSIKNDRFEMNITKPFHSYVGEAPAFQIWLAISH
jgi:hypothetical protein